jgi:hypothetical protein
MWKGWGLAVLGRARGNWKRKAEDWGFSRGFTPGVFLFGSKIGRDHATFLRSAAVTQQFVTSFDF